jgi:hypothetical protein
VAVSSFCHLLGSEGREESAVAQRKSDETISEKPKDPGFALQRQGCLMVYFQTKTPNLDKIGRAVEMKILLHFMTIWYLAIWYN